MPTPETHGLLKPSLPEGPSRPSIPIDLSPEPVVHGLLNLAADLFDAPIALVSLLDDTRQWFKACIGLAGEGTPRGDAFCAHAVELAPRAIMVVEDATLDPRFAANPLVLGEPFIRFYAGAVLTTVDGRNLGTLCVIDPRPRPHPDAKMLERLRALADLVIGALDLGQKRREGEQRERLLDLAARMSNVGHWRFDIITGHVEWSDEVYRIHGVDRVGFNPNLQSGLDFYVEEDRVYLEKLIETSIRNRVGFNHELRIRRADGEVRNVASRAICERDADGRAAALVGVFQDVTETVRALRESQRNERRYRLLADNMADVVTRIRGDGSSGYISPAITGLLGYLPEEMTGHAVQAFVHFDDRWMVTDTLTQLVKDGGQRTLQHRALHKEGHAIWVETHFRIIPHVAGEPTDIVAVIRDISRQKGIEAALAESEARYRLLTENARDVIMHTGLDGRLTYISPSLMEVMGFAPEEVIGQPTLNFILPEDAVVMREAVGRQVAGRGRLPPVSVQCRVRNRDGQLIWLEARPTLVLDPITGRMTGITDIARDITDRKSLEAELRAARAEAEQAATAKADFLANMSHELRTPLSSIVGFAGLIAAAPELDDETRRRAKIVQGASRSLVAIVNDVLDVSKFEAEGVQLDPQPVELEDLLEDTVQLLHDEAFRKGVALTLQVLRRGPPVLVDPARLRQVVLNLLGNAVKFTNRGGVTLSLSEDARGRIKISVRDTGIGIPRDRLDSVFERFAQADGSVSRKFGGTGLGLTICRTIVQAMGGEIGVDSVHGAGSTFWLVIDPPPVTGFAPALMATMPAPASVRGRRLLLADDNSINRELFQALMAGSGLEITEAVNGAEVVRAVQEDVFDLVLMDVQMPVMDGLEATRALRMLGFDDLPIIAVTANVMTAQIEQCREAGLNDHLAKPYTAQDVLRIVTRWTADAAPQTPEFSDGHGAEARIAEEMLTSLEATIGAAAVDRFLGSLAEQFQSMTAVLSDPAVDRAETARIAHSVRGLAGTLGFAGVTEVYSALERACGGNGDVEALKAQARRATGRSLEEIARRRSGRGA